MAMIQRLTFVTSNANKLREVRAILDHDIVSQDLDLPEIQGTTQEVALHKVSAAAVAIGGACITEVCNSAAWDEVGTDGGRDG